MIHIIKNTLSVIERELPIKIFDENTDLIEKDKFGIEYINWMNLPVKYDDQTYYIADLFIRWAQHIELFNPNKGLKIRHIWITKQHGDMQVPWGNEKAWNRLNIHIPLNKCRGGLYTFQGIQVSPIPSSILMFDGLEDFWSVAKMENQSTSYKLVIQYENLDPNLIYTGQNQE